MHIFDHESPLVEKKKAVLNSGFFSRVYDIVAQIPAGKVATYGQIARMAGEKRWARQVGYAMAAAPAERKLPCHRVVNQLGELAPEHVFGDPEFQRCMLENEGVNFQLNGRIDMKRHLWRAES